MKLWEQMSALRRTTRPVKFAVVGLMLLCFGVAAWHALAGAPAAETLSAEEALALPQPESAAEEEAIAAGEEENAAEENAAEEVAAYFAAYRLDREQARAEESRRLQEVIDHPNSTAAARDEASARLLELAAAAQAEQQAEALLKAKGYGETVVILSPSRATVLVALELDDSLAAAIAESVDGATGCGFANVVIVNR